MIYYIKTNLWQQIFVIQPIEAESKEQARETFLKMLEDKKVKDIVIEAIVDEDGLEDLMEDDDNTPGTSLH